MMIMTIPHSHQTSIPAHTHLLSTTQRLCMQAINQDSSNPQNKEDVSHFAAVLKACSGGTIVCIDLESSNPATRLWCVFEWSQTVTTHGPDGLHMVGITLEQKDTLITKVNVAMAECFAKVAAQRPWISTGHGLAIGYRAKWRISKGRIRS